MPNWTANIIRAEGVEADLREFLEAVRGPDTPLDFNRIVPMPPLLRHTASGSRSFDGACHRSWYLIDPDLRPGDPGWEDNERPFTVDEEAALRYIGYRDWYDWRIAHWGTKWNACHAEILEMPDENGAVEIAFDTAWAAPLPVFDELAARFPRLALKITWNDEDEPYITHSRTVPASEGRAA